MDKPFVTDGDENVGDSDKKDVIADREREEDAENESDDRSGGDAKPQNHVEINETPETQVQNKKSDLAIEKAKSTTNTPPESYDLRNLYATWRTRQEFSELTGISEYQLRKLFNTKEFKENQTLGYATHYKLPIEIDRSGNAYKYRVNCDGLLTYSELIEKHPELADFKKFTKEARLKDRKIKRLNFLNNRKLESEYLLYQYIFDKSTGLFKIEISQKKNRKS